MMHVCNRYMYICVCMLCIYTYISCVCISLHENSTASPSGGSWLPPGQEAEARQRPSLLQSVQYRLNGSKLRYTVK